MFLFIPGNFRPSSDYHYCSLHFVLKVKTDIIHKVKLVCGGSWVNPNGLPTHATVEKGISLYHLDFIVDSQYLWVIIGNIRNTFIQIIMNKRFTLVLNINLMNIQINCLHYQNLLLLELKCWVILCYAWKFSCILIFFLSRFYHDAWMQFCNDIIGYSYILMYVDDSKVVDV